MILKPPSPFCRAICHIGGRKGQPTSSLYRLHDFVAAPNHIHVLVSPQGADTLSEILHSWKSFTAHEIVKLIKSGKIADSGNSGRAVPALKHNTIWQKESFDHIVRSPASMEKFRAYIRDHPGAQTGQSVLTK